MAEVIYSLNGKFFKDFDIFISSSDGLFDGLKPKKQNTYDWAEYSGIASDINQKKIFEPRKFTLTGFVKGSDWDEMLTNFWAVFGDLNKVGRQRLLIEPFGVKTLVYDVTNEESIDIKKTFKDGESYALFTIKLIEQKPIKKILYTDKNSLQLSFNSPKYVEVNIDGEISTYKGEVVLSEALTPRVLSLYDFGGRNYIKDSWIDSDWGASDLYAFERETMQLEAGQYTFSFKGYTTNGINNIQIYSSNGFSRFVEMDSTYDIKSITLDLLAGAYYVRIGATNVFHLDYYKLERGNKATPWMQAPEDKHFISIAGEIDEITNLTTNAEVLWEKL